MAQVGLEVPGRPARAHGQLALAGPRLSRRPRGVAQGRRGHGCAARGERVVGGEDEAHPLAQQPLAGQAGRPRPRDAEVLLGDEDVERLEPQGGQRRLELGLDELDAQGGVGRRDGAQRGGDDPQRRGLERGDADRAADDAARRRQRGLGLLGPPQQRVGVLGEDPSRGGEAHAAPGRLEQRHPRLALQGGQALRDR